jgi:hypothetical protein
MQGAGFLYIYDYDVLFKGSGSVQFGPSEQLAGVTFTGAGHLIPNASTDYGRATFPAFVGQGFDAGLDGYGHGSGVLPGLVGWGESSTYIPEEGQYGFGLFPILYGGGVSIGVGVSTANVSFPAFVCQGGEGDYGHGAGVLPSIKGYGVDDFTPGSAPMVTIMYVLGAFAPAMDHIVFINNIGQIVDTITASRELIQHVIESLSAEGSFTILGEYMAYFDSSLAIRGDSPGFIDGKAAVNQGSRVWVVNMETGASSQYDDYGFESFFQDENTGEYFGVAEDGIYRLDGDNDAGVDINSLLEIGSSNYGTHRIKKSTGLYVGCSSTGKLYMKVVTDGVERIYQMTNHSATVQIHKIPISHRQLGTQWNLTLMNADGDDFDVSTIDFRIIETTRRIK